MHVFMSTFVCVWWEVGLVDAGVHEHIACVCV